MKTKKRLQKQKTNSTINRLTFHKLDWLEKLTLGLGIWFLVYPKPYTLLFTTLLLIPIVGLVLNGLAGRPSIASLVEITRDTDGSDKYDVADFIDLAAVIILLRVLIDFEFESLYSLIIPGIFAFVIMVTLLFTTHKLINETTKSKSWIYTSIIFNVFLYSFAGTYGVNCVYDYSEPKVYEAKVVDKRISTGRKGRKTYYIQVTPWGHHYDKEEISVASSQYDDTQVGEKVKIDVKEGLFNIPWYYIE